jgi:hypothetical protein
MEIRQTGAGEPSCPGADAAPGRGGSNKMSRRGRRYRRAAVIRHVDLLVGGRMEGDADVTIVPMSRRVAEVVEVRPDDDVLVAESGIPSLDDRTNVVCVALDGAEELVVRCQATVLLDAHAIRQLTFIESRLSP